MTAAPTTAPRRPTTPLMLAAAVLISVLVVTIVLSRTTVVDPAPIDVDLPTFSVSQHGTAGALAAARHELRALSSAVRDVPSITASQRDRMTLLRLVGAGSVPVQALTQPVAPSLDQLALQARAETLTAARHELAGLTRAVADTPSIADSQREHMTLLHLVATNQVPAETLDR